MLTIIIGLIRLHKDSRTFKMTRGVKQGDPISPKLFTACLELAFRKLNGKQAQEGIKIVDDIISILRFADDIAIFGISLKELKVMLVDLSRESAMSSANLKLDMISSPICCL